MHYRPLILIMTVKIKTQKDEILTGPWQSWLLIKTTQSGNTFSEDKMATS